MNTWFLINLYKIFLLIWFAYVFAARLAIGYALLPAILHLCGGCDPSSY